MSRKNSGPPRNNKERLWSCVTIDDNGCWNWNKSKSRSGYGKVSYHNRSWRAHRLSYYFKHGVEPEVVCHSCDNRACINPAHLFAGNHKINMKDMANKGRAAKPKGSIHPISKLTEDKVIEIKSLGIISVQETRQIANKMGVSYQCIRDVVIGRRWSHL